MRCGKAMMALSGFALMVGGCATTGNTNSSNGFSPDRVKVTVRFVIPPEPTQMAGTMDESSFGQLVSDPTQSTFINDGGPVEAPMEDPSPYHVVLWGGPFDGANVTYASAPLMPGPYMFGLFDHDRGSVYQGWINVNTGGQDVLSMLTNWRDAVREQQTWLGFDSQIAGSFQSPDHTVFKSFRKELRSLRNLETRLDRSIQSEIRRNRRIEKSHRALLSKADILLMPGGVDFFRPSTQPAFGEAELTAVREGKAVTKVVLMADYPEAMDKLERVKNLRDDLKRSRAVFVEYAKRLNQQKRLFTMTDHLYNHNLDVVEFEQRRQQAFAMIARIDQQISEHRRHCQSLMFMASLFSPDGDFEAFDAEQNEMERERVVLEEQKHQLDIRFDQLPDDSQKRITLERDRQALVAAIESVDRQIDEVGESKEALASLRQTTHVIHRHGSTRILSAAMFDENMPVRIVEAIEKESIMTIRLQATESLFTPGDKNRTATTPQEWERTAVGH